MNTTTSFSKVLVPALLPALAAASLLAGCNRSAGETMDETTILTDSDSSSSSTNPTGPSTLGSTTSTVTTLSPSGGSDSTSTASDTDTSTTEDSDGSTTQVAPCNFDGICDADETSPSCLHDCGSCEPDEFCDDGFENPYACPSDCAATSCDQSGTIDALDEQCDDGNDDDDDACTNSCEHNVCGDGYLFADDNGGDEECDDGNLDDGDGCDNKCAREVRQVFISSEIFQGNFKPQIGDFFGVELADAHCQELADAADLPGVYKAWLSQGNKSPKNRFGIDDTFLGRYERPDGVPIAEGWSGLTSGTLMNKIDADETGAEGGGAAAWTNTATDGSSKGSYDCQEWSSKSSMDKGGYGSSEYLDENWTELVELNSCLNSARVYCIQVE